MNLALLFPAALAALAALLVPLLLHLVRRPQQPLVDFAALRWLSTASRPQRRVVLEERLLLAVRLLLLAVLAMLLAQPVLQKDASSGTWTVIAVGVDPGRVRAEAGGNDDGAQWRWLAPGFPAITGPEPTGTHGDTASLLRELDAQLPPDIALTVHVPDVVRGLDGARLALGRSVDWRIVAGAMASPDAAGFEPPTLALRHSDHRATARTYLEAAVAAWQLDAPQTQPLDARSDQSLPGAAVDTLVWLHGGELPAAIQAWMAAGRTVVLEASETGAGTGDDGVPVWRDGGGHPLAHARRVGAGRLLTLTRGFDPRTLPVLLDPDFPLQLQQVLQARSAPASAPASAHAPIRSGDAAGGPGLEQARQALFPWLAVLLALLVLVERVLATRARRWQP